MSVVRFRDWPPEFKPVLATCGNRLFYNQGIISTKLGFQMKVFLSWSGERSKQVADAMGLWLSQVIQAIDPWISSEIEKGARWQNEVAGELERCDFGVICLTSDNLTAPWILFEAGALAKNADGRVCTFLLDVQPTEVQQPLAQFQATRFERGEVFQLVSGMNRRLRENGGRALADVPLTSMFDRMWPELEQVLQSIAAAGSSGQSKKRKAAPTEEFAILQEILRTVRRLEGMIGEEERITGILAAKEGTDVDLALRDLSSSVSSSENLSELMRRVNSSAGLEAARKVARQYESLNLAKVRDPALAKRLIDVAKVLQSGGSSSIASADDHVATNSRLSATSGAGLDCGARESDGGLSSAKTGEAPAQKKKNSPD